MKLNIKSDNPTIPFRGGITVIAGKSSTKRNVVFDEWVKNPYITAKKICELHQYNYEKHGNYINRLLSEFRSYTDLGLPQEPLRLEHRTFEWICISRVYENGDEMPLSVWKTGWRVAHDNNNGMWVFRSDLGSVHWYKEGKVLLYLKGELQLAKVKELFCKAFGFMTQDKAFFEKYLDVPLREVYRKWIFEMGKPVPKFDIRTFERSHGLRIFTDLSHPTSIHVGEAQPFWIDEQRQATAELGSVVQQFGVEIKEHLKLIQLWQDEARANRVANKFEETKNMDRTVLNPIVPAKSSVFEKDEFNDFLHEY